MNLRQVEMIVDMRQCLQCERDEIENILDLIVRYCPSDVGIPDFDRDCDWKCFECWKQCIKKDKYEIRGDK